MLGLLLIYYIGKYFYRLSEEYGKKKWLYSILGIVSYYSGAILFGLGWGLYIEVSGQYQLYEADSWVIELAAIPFCLATCILFYMLLRHLWSSKDTIDTLDDWET